MSREEYELVTEPAAAEARNVLGEPLAVCSLAPMTGFFRTGCCETGPRRPRACTWSARR